MAYLPLNRYRKLQLCYLFADFCSAIIVWICFLWFRWLVQEGYSFGVNTVLIPTFTFWKPLLFYPIGCIIINYLSGYYIRPTGKTFSREFLLTFFSSLCISFLAFFIIIIDDKVTDYKGYLLSLAVLLTLQFILCYLPRLIITIISRNKEHKRIFYVHNIHEIESFERAWEVKPFDEVIIDLNKGEKQEDTYTIINRIYPYKIPISVVPQIYDILMGAAHIGELHSTPLIRITEPNMNACELCIKRAFDVTVSLVSLLILSPLFLIIFIIVRATSQGPAIYKQQRIGMYGIPFKILKFRTMYTHTEDDNLPTLTADHDPRITNIGNILRKYRLDELPQLWNVLKGDMSIVGPRPERKYFIDKIRERAPYYCLLYKIRPGLTSWGPIKVGYTDTIDKMIERLNYDMAYIGDMSIKLDIKILFYTIGILLKGTGK